MALPPTGRISTRTRRRTAAAAGAAQPAVDYGFGPAGSRGRLLSGRPSAARFAPSASFVCRPERISSINGCPDGTNPA